MSYTFKLLDSVTLPLTQELIDEFATMAGSITERPKDDTRAAYIRNRVTSGLAVTFGWAKAQIEGEKKWWRVNGQHSSGELQELQKLGAMPEGLVAHVDSYVVPDKAALVALFRQFDPRQSSRTPLEVANAYASVEDQLVNIDRKIIKLAAEGIWWYRRTVAKEADTATGDDRYAIVMEPQYLEFIKWLDGLLHMKTTEMKKPQVIAALWATYQVSFPNAAEFWGDVAGAMPSAGAVDNISSGTDSTDAADVLDAYYLKALVKINNISPADTYQGSIYAWNAYMDEKPITKINPPSWRAKGFLQPKHPAGPVKVAAE